MLSIAEGHGINRRAFLTLGSLGLGGLSLADLLAGTNAESGADPLTGKAVIFVFQQGGPSQFETFDPKPEAPSGNRSVTGSIPTSVPGVRFSASMPQLATLAHKLTVVRSFQTNNGGHNIQPIVGESTLGANVGTHYARVAGASRPATGMPTNAVLFPNAVDSNVPRGSARGDIDATGPYPSAYAPFVPGSHGPLQDNMDLKVSRRRFGDRRQLLGELGRVSQQMEQTGALDTAGELQSQAYQVLLSGHVSEALDLSNEDPATVERYDTSDYASPGNWDQVSRGKKGYYTGSAQTIGKLLLLSRRLCEAGCGFVTVHAGYRGVWDMHADGNNLDMINGMSAVGGSFDHAVAALIRDIEERGLENDILVVATGEMGRTPQINEKGGRDHWGRLTPLLLYGAGAPRGAVVGEADRRGGEPATDNLTPSHLVSTVLRTVLDPGKLRLRQGLPSPLIDLVDADPIPLT